MHPRIDRAVALAARVVPGAEGALRRSLGHALRWTARTPADAGVWAASTLGRVRFPLEFAFATWTPELRYTVDVAPAGVPAHERFALACETLEPLGLDTVDELTAHRVADLQRGKPLKYGAYLGVRHRAGGIAGKVYAEVEPEAALRWAREHTCGFPQLGVRIVPQMIGLDAGSGGVELYARVEHLRTDHLFALVEPVDAPRRAREIVAVIERACSTVCSLRLPARTWGISYRFGADGRATGLTVYTFAHTLFGSGDGAIRRAVLDYGRHAGWDLAYYAALTEPLAQTSGYATHHGLFGIVLAAGAEPGVTVGVAPPEAA